MEEQRPVCCLISKQDLLGVYKTIYLFLENQNFHETCTIFRKECNLFGCHLPNISGSVKIVRSAKHLTLFDGNHNESFMLESSFCEMGAENASEMLIKSDLPRNSTETAQNTSTHNQDFVRLKRSFHNLREEHKKLIAVTTELTSALQSNIMGQSKSYHTVLDECKTIYPALFPQSAEKVPQTESTPIPIEIQDKESEGSNFFINICTETVNMNECGDKTSLVITPSKENTSLERPETRGKVRTSEKEVANILDSLIITVTQSPKLEPRDSVPETPMPSPRDEIDAKTSPIPAQKHGVFPLDYGKIKRDLIEGKSELRLALLQALRWRVTKSGGPIVNSVLIEYISNDLLDLTSPKSASLPETYLRNIDNISENLLECFSRLLNTFASFKTGRDYLSNYKHALDALLQLKFLNNKEICSNFTRDMFVALIQKLSLRRPIRKRILHLGSVDELLQFLNKHHNKVSEYCLEYATALLMNLSLEDEARGYFAKKANLLVNLLKKLLNGKECCLPYVNGTLYSVLINKEIRDVAIDLDLDKAILFKIETVNDPNLRKQLEIVISTRFNLEVDPFDGETEITEEVDLLESELDECDIIVSNTEIGEKLLEQYKLQVKSPEIGKVRNFCRPVTPAALKSATATPNISEQEFRSPNLLSAPLFTDSAQLSRRKDNFQAETFQKFDKLFKPSYSSPIKHKVSSLHKKRISRNRNFANSVCYMDNPYRTRKNGETRYSCSCYDTIKREVETDVESENNNNKKSTFSEFFKIPERIFLDRSTSQSRCNTCVDRSCECAFEPRPKLLRTPPEKHFYT